MTFDEIGSAIADKTGARPTRHALVESVYRIRKALKGADLNEYVIRVDPKASRLRFLLRLSRGDATPRPLPKHMHF